MFELTKEKALEVLSSRVADYRFAIYIYIPSQSFVQPIVMYKTAVSGFDYKNYTTHEKVSGMKSGMHIYQGEK